MSPFVFKEIEAKHLIQKSGLAQKTYSVNPYVGCQHACAYCYACFMRRFTNHTEPWGTFVDAKINAGALFPLDFRRLKDAEAIFFGSVTDVYQPVEERYGLMRQILAFLAEEESPPSPALQSTPSRQPLFPEMNAEPTQVRALALDSADIQDACRKRSLQYHLLTKSDLVLRDLDLLRRIPNLSVGFSIALSDERARQCLEPGTVSLERRLSALEQLHEAGIRTFVFINPVLPLFTELETIFPLIADKTDSVFGESLNARSENWPKIIKAVEQYDSRWIPPFVQSLKNPDFWLDIKAKFSRLALQFNIPSDGFHIHATR